MSLGIFLTLAIIGVDFLIYFLFQWMYGEKRAAIVKKVAAQRRAIEEEAVRPFVVRSPRAGAVTRERVRKIRERMGSGAGQRRLA
jgi:hypothetical protein